MADKMIPVYMPETFAIQLREYLFNAYNGKVPAAEPEPSKQVERDSGFKFGAKSQAELVGVHPPLVEVCCLALKLSTQDFMIFDGKRTEEEQRKHVANGTSKTMQSLHLNGLAVDAVPVNAEGQPVWNWKLIWPVACAFDKAATQLGVADKIRWGGAWDRRLSDFGGTSNAYEAEARLYAIRHPGEDFLDGPHFEWVG